jgi:hypothetical protein
MPISAAYYPSRWASRQNPPESVPDLIDMATPALQRLQAVVWLADQARTCEEPSPAAWAGVVGILDDAACVLAAVLEEIGRRNSRS